MFILKCFLHLLTCISLLAVVMHSKYNQGQDSSNMVVYLVLVLQYPCYLLMAL